MTLTIKHVLRPVGVVLVVATLAGCLLYLKPAWVGAVDGGAGTVGRWPVVVVCVAVVLTAFLQHLLHRRRMQVPPRHEQAEARQSIGDSTDISGRTRDEEAAQELQALRGGIKAMNDMMAVVGHELRTPLAAVRAMAECLIQEDIDPNSPQAKGFLQAIHDETVHMANLVSNLLEAARLDSGHARWNWGRWSIADALHDAVNVLRPLIDTSRVQLQIDCGCEEIVMNGDREAITRLLINLLSNSVKHTSSGSIVVSARRDCHAPAQTVELKVRDTGAGIPSPVLSKLGYAFATNEGTVSANFARGSGLGLSICRVICSVHGGEISVASEPGSGSTFTARLRTDLDAPVEQKVDVIHVRGEAA